MRPIVIGTINKSELGKFEEECEKLGWMYLGVSGDEVVYLDRRMTKHTLDLSEKTELIII